MTKNTYVQKITRTAVLLAVILVIQCFKNFSVWISGPVVNAVLIIAVLGAGLWSGILLSVISPITSYLITGAPIMALTKFTLFPVIMLGNIAIVVGVYIFMNRGKLGLVFGMFAGSVVKWLVMWAAVSLLVFPAFADVIAGKPALVTALTWTFTHFQLIAALIGSVIAYLIWIPLKKFLKK